MRFRNLSTFVGIFVCVVAGIVAFYFSLWNSHREKLEPRLYAFLLNEEIDDRLRSRPPSIIEHEGVVYETRLPAITIIFALGHSHGNEKWIVPSPKLISSIAIPSVEPVSNSNYDEDVFYVENIRWLNWNTVLVDVGRTIGLDVKRTENIKLRFQDEKWKIIDTGDVWII